MRTIIRIITLLFINLSLLYPATLTIVSKYGRTGGIVGDLNHVSDQLNGRTICNAINEYSNEVAGCDMSADAGYNDNGTGNPSDDYYTGDLIVRTNDSFEILVGYAWLGNAGGKDEEVTIRGELPTGVGFIWDSVPPSCKASRSKISEDGKKITCVRKDFDTTDTGSFAEDFAFMVKVEGNAVNGSTPGDIKISIEEPTGTAGVVTDGVKDGKENNLIKVTASPRWNIEQLPSPGYNTITYGAKDAEGNSGWYLWYQFSIEVDHVKDEKESGVNPLLGNEALFGDKETSITFTEDLSRISPNAKLVTWANNKGFRPRANACSMDYLMNYKLPYPYHSKRYPSRSIPIKKGRMDVSCIQNGNKVTVKADKIDTTLTHAPTTSIIGRALPVTQRMAAIGVMRVFVPLSDVEQGEDGITGTKDDNKLSTTVCIQDFTPKGISGVENFMGLHESEKDNCRHLTLYAAKGSWSKSYRRGWSDQADQAAIWGGKHWTGPTDSATSVMTGDGIVTPGGYWGTYTAYVNKGGTPIDNPTICDVIDVETYEMAIIDPEKDNPKTFLDDTKHAVDLNNHDTENLPGLRIEYATGYVGDWPPNPDVAPGFRLAKECSDSSVKWYPDVLTAEAADKRPVSKVRITADTLPVKKRMGVRIKHRAREQFLSTGEAITNNTTLVNYATCKSKTTKNKYIYNSYKPHAANKAHQGLWTGDRIILQRAKARIAMAVSHTSVTLGDEVSVVLNPSFTTHSENSVSSDMSLAVVLPMGMEYQVGSTLGNYGQSEHNYGEPTRVIVGPSRQECEQYAKHIVATGHPCGSTGNGREKETILVWHLGTQTTGTTYRDLNFTAVVSIEAPSSVLSTYAQIDAEEDSSPSSKKIANGNVKNSVPSSLLIVQKVLTPTHMKHSGGLLNWMKFRVGIRNGSSKALTNLDVIDILPFKGDGEMGSFSFSPSSDVTVERKREDATDYKGLFQFDNISFDGNGGCDTDQIEYWFTNVQGPLDISPLHPSNLIPSGSVPWCKGTTTGPDGVCGFDNAAVTAVRTRGVTMPGSVTCYAEYTFATAENADKDIYANTVSAQAKGVTNAVLSNNVVARVHAGSIGGKVWLDINSDGIQDANETEGINHTTVNLYDKEGELLSTTKSNEEGQYGFSGLLVGEYVLEFVAHSSYTWSGKSRGEDFSLDSDVDVESHKTDLIVLKETDAKKAIDLGLYLGFNGLTISGTVRDDGHSDDNPQGPAIKSIDEKMMFVTLLNKNDKILDTQLVDCSGNYHFDSVRPNTRYIMVLSTLENAKESTLTAHWSHTEGDKDGKIFVSLDAQSMEHIDFAINNKPKAEDITFVAKKQPSGLVSTPVPDLRISDWEETPTIVTITRLPENAKLYYQDKEVVLNEEIKEVDVAGFSLHSTNCNTGVSFDYTTTDAAGAISPVATVKKVFALFSLAGTVYYDENEDGSKSEITLQKLKDELLYVTLLDQNNTLIKTQAVDEDGHYSFDTITSRGSYSVVLSIKKNARESSLPMGWMYTNNASTGKITTNVGSPRSGDADFVLRLLPGYDFQLKEGVYTKDEKLYSNLNTHIWLDINHDEVRQASEKDKEGIEVLLLDENGSIATCMEKNMTVPCVGRSDKDGNFSFNLRGGKYTLEYKLDREDISKGYSFPKKSNISGSTMKKELSFTLKCGQTLEVEASIDCGYQEAPIKANDGDALDTLSMLLMLFLTTWIAQYYTRRENKLKISKQRNEK